MQRRQELQQEVQRLIRPHLSEDVEPPFCASELIAIALVLGDGLDHGMTAEDVLFTIVTTFAYYGYRAIRAHTLGEAEMHYNTNVIVASVSTVHGFWQAFESYNLPVTSKLQNDRLKGCQHWLHCMTTSEARFTLRRHLGAERRGTFDFLELPAEIRNQIYEYALCFHGTESGLMFDYRTTSHCECCHWSRRAPKVFRRINGASAELRESHAVHIGTRRWMDSSRAELCNDLHEMRNDIYTEWTACRSAVAVQCSDEQQALAILSTNRQIYTEAGSVFYGANTFTLFDLETLHEWLAKLASRNIEHLANVNVRLDFQCKGLRSFHTLRAVTQALKPVKKLNRLSVDIRPCFDHDWLKLSQGKFQVLGRKKDFTQLLEIHGMSDLALFISKAEELEIFANSTGSAQEQWNALVWEEPQRIRHANMGGNLSVPATESRKRSVKHTGLQAVAKILGRLSAKFVSR